MLKWLLTEWYSHCRNIDLKILWPACRDGTPDLTHARAAFALHAFEDRAWLVLGEEEIKSFIDTLY